MNATFGPRLRVWRLVLAGPWKWLLTVPLAALGAFQAVCDEFFPAQLQEKLRLPEWLPNWSWQTWVVLALAVLLLSIVESTYQLVRESKALRINVMGVIVEAAVASIGGVANPPRWPAKYVKVGIQAAGETIEGCTPYVLKLRRVIDGQESETQLVDPITLFWASSGGTQTLDLQPALPRYFDLLDCNRNSNRLSFGGGVAVPLKAEGFFSAVGTYLLTLQVLAKNGVASPEVVVAVEWAGDWETVTAKIVGRR